MTTQLDSYRSSILRVLAGTPVAVRLRARAALVLERIAYGAGETCWYYCEADSQLEHLARELRPGSILCFYFDDRLSQTLSSDALTPATEILRETGEVLIGVLAVDKFHVDMNMILDEEEIVELLAELPSNTTVYVGVFPAPDNDGINAVSVIVPDLDGVVRAHPH